MAPISPLVNSLEDFSACLEFEIPLSDERSEEFGILNSVKLAVKSISEFQ